MKKGMESELLLDNIFENFPGNIYWLDTQGNVLGCNEGLAIMTGFRSSSDIIGKNVSDFAAIPEMTSSD